MQSTWCCVPEDRPYESYRLHVFALVLVYSLLLLLPQPYIDSHFITLFVARETSQVIETLSLLGTLLR